MITKVYYELIQLFNVVLQILMFRLFSNVTNIYYMTSTNITKAGENVITTYFFHLIINK